MALNLRHVSTLNLAQSCKAGKQRFREVKVDCSESCITVYYALYDILVLTIIIIFYYAG